MAYQLHCLQIGVEQFFLIQACPEWNIVHWFYCGLNSSVCACMWLWTTVCCIVADDTKWRRSCDRIWQGRSTTKNTSTEHMDVRTNQRIQQQQVQPANETPVQRSGTWDSDRKNAQMPIQGIPSASIASQQARQVGEWGRHLGQKHFSWLDQRYAGAEVGDTIEGLAINMAAQDGSLRGRETDAQGWLVSTILLERQSFLEETNFPSKD